MSDRLRRCRAIHPDDPTMQCQGEVTEMSMHIEDHWNGRDGKISRWPVIRMPEWNATMAPVANPERVKAGEERLTPAQRARLDLLREVAPGWTARDQQVGGDHYRKHAIQVWDIVDEYGLSYYAGLALKYLLRAGDKGPKAEDLRKARHVLDRMIELEEKKEE